MKRLLVLLFCAIGVVPALAQVPKLINYQGVVRDAAGIPLVNRVISVKMELRTGASGPIQWEAIETLTTSPLGLFTTQIGKLNPAQFATVNWMLGDLFLVVAVDTTNGSSHITMGAQQLVSVPFALHALSVPVTFTNNVLSIGQQTVGFQPATTYTAGTGISIVSGSIVSTPTLSLNNNSLGISGGNTVTLPASVATLISSGAAVTSTLAPNSYSLHVEPPTFSSNGGPVTISGIHPNYTINSVSAGNPTLVTSGIITSTASGNSFSLSAPATSISPGNSNIQVTGSYPDFTVSASPQLSLDASGNLSISNGNTVNVTPQISRNGNTLQSGPATNTVQLDAYTQGNGISITGGPSYTITSLATTTSLTPGANNNVSVTGSAPSYTVSAPSYSISTPTATSVVLSNGVNSSSATLRQYAAGPGLVMSGTAPNHTISASTSGTTGVWSTLGNSGTNATNFIGTTDNNPLNFKVNNQKAGAINHNTQNTFIGYRAANAITTGSINTGFGYLSLRDLTSGNQNTGFGRSSLMQNTTGDNNTAVGSEALNFNTTGSFNTAVGYNSMYDNTFGEENVGLGSAALSNNTTGSNNVAVGFAAGLSVATGSGNVFIGNRAGQLETGSNKLYIANNSSSVTPLIAGDFNLLRVGIATGAPEEMLQVGSFQLNQNNYMAVRTAGGNTFKAGIKFNHFDVTDGFTIESNEIQNRLDFIGHAGTSHTVMSMDRLSGRVGIGTAAPTATLHLAGTFRLQDGTEGANRVLTSDALGNASWQPQSAAAWGLSGNAGTTPATQFIGTNDNQDLVIRTNNTERMRINSAGKIGVGTSTPGHELHIENSVGAVIGLVAGNTAVSSLAFGTTTNNFLGNIRYDNNTNSMSFWTNNTNDRIYINNNGQIGFGTTNVSAYNLSIFGPAGSSMLRLFNNNTTTSGFVIGQSAFGASIVNDDNTPLYFGTNGANLMSIQPAGELRIGNNPPFDPNTGLIISRPGAFSNRLIITGGDNNNNHGGIVTLTENLAQSQGMSIRLNAGGNYLWFTTDPAGTSPIMQVSGYTGATPGVVIGNGYAGQLPPVNGLLVQGRMGIGTTIADGGVHSIYSQVGEAAFKGVSSFNGAGDSYAFHGIATANPGWNIGGNFDGGYIGAYGHVNNNYVGAIFGVYGSASGSGGVRYGVFGIANNGTINYAGYFSGNVHVNGTLSKNAGTFKIDHPQDPLNKYLVHSFVESPDMLNIYNGNVVTDAGGNATVQLPSYFEAANRDFRYQLTVIGQFAQAIVLNEISGNTFTIKTDKPDVKVSWMVTGVRNDEFAKQNPIEDEIEKRAEEKGRYLNPELYGLPASAGIHPPADPQRLNPDGR